MIEEILELIFGVVGLYGATSLVLRWRGQSWSGIQAKQRRLLLWMSSLGAVLMHVTEDVLTHASSQIDAKLLLWIHQVIPGAFKPAFKVLTWSASAKVVFPAVGLAVVALLVKRRYWESAVLTSSLVGSVALVYLVKTAIQRVRPTLWDTQSYWGSSFPSGHTLTATALATAACICAGRQWPHARAPMFAIATCWALLVGLSRLVLGVHWPTDVLAALCAGALLALGMATATRLVGSHAGLRSANKEGA